jgi:hypothetical protein
MKEKTMTTRDQYQKLSPEEREQLLARNRAWREQWRAEHPEEYQQQKREAAARITQKYNEDEAFRARRREYLKRNYQQLSEEQRELRRQRQREAYQRKKQNKILAQQLSEDLTKQEHEGEAG